MKTQFITAAPGPEGRYPENLYFTPETDTGRPALVGTPGLLEFCDTGTSAEVRGLFIFGNYLYAVVGSTFYQVSGGGVATSKGTVAGNSGKVWMERNLTQIMIVADDSGYIYTPGSGTLAAIAGTDFPTPGSLTAQDGYFIVHEKDTDYVYISALNDGTSWDALDYAAAEGSAENVVAVISDHKEVIPFSLNSAEFWYNSGATFPFDRVSGAYLEIGLGAKASLTRLDNILFWLDGGGVVRRLEGYSPIAISTREMERKISEYSTFTDAIGFGMKYQGMPFYILAFPNGDETWAYNIATGFWHIWKSGTGRHRSNCYAYFIEKHIVGDYANGKLYYVDGDTYTDDGDEIIRKRTGPPISDQDHKRFFVNRFEIEFQEGVGLSGGASPGEDPQAMLRWSNDRGRTWSNEHWRSIGKIGEYKNRAIWRRLGISRNWTPELTISDPVPVTIYDANIAVVLGNS